VSRTKKLAEAILKDRERRAAPRIATAKTKVEGSDFDPFAVTRWRVVAGDSPGYLVATPMRRGPVGWFIACRACAVEFESKGWAYCPDCMALPAEARRREATTGKRPDYAAPADSSVGASNRISTLENAHKTQSIIGPADWPINIVGRRLPREKPNPLSRVRVRP
jgi:hypothetical protein